MSIQLDDVASCLRSWSAEGLQCVAASQSLLLSMHSLYVDECFLDLDVMAAARRCS